MLKRTATVPTVCPHCSGRRTVLVIKMRRGPGSRDYTKYGVEVACVQCSGSGIAYVTVTR